MRAPRDFTIDELIRSATAERLGIDNFPPPEEMANLRQLAVKILQPLRDAWQRPIIVTSGYRSPALNKALGGARNSQHLMGQAADICATDPADNKALFLTAVRLIQEGTLQVGQLIDEYAYQWIHISLPTPRLRNQILHLP
ncbi:MAG: DUF882 domain-containing protein [Bacteroidaceae bacterium]|nr:DUF882 domain-containing protein [Bacteroidaceae bacterium]